MVRFDKPCKQVSAAVKYFRTHMAKKDYLSQGGQEELSWVGEGAKQLGLSGHVRETEFARLCEGKHPVTGARLAARESGPVKRVCYFGQISPPKDVSIAYLVGGDERIPSRPLSGSFPTATPRLPTLPKARPWIAVSFS